MKVAVTGATGFLGRYIVRQLVNDGHHCSCWYRESSDRGGFDDVQDGIEWIPGELGDVAAGRALVADRDAIVHSALWRPGPSFQGDEGDLAEYMKINVLETIRLIERARMAGVGRFVFISTCAVHDVILPDRPLDEAHPLWPKSHYGAHKAAIEAIVHSIGLGDGYPICALRPTGIYGLAHPPENSKWFDLVRAVKRGEPVECRRGGKEVHAADVAKAIALLLTADGIAGQSYNCYDMYISQFDVATLAKEMTGSNSEILGGQTCPKNQIVTDKIRALGMTFGGTALLRDTIAQLVAAADDS